MSEQLSSDACSNGLFSKVTAFTRKHRKVSLLIALVLTIFSVTVSPLIPYISDPTEYFPVDDPEVSFWLDMTRQFGGLDMLMVGLEEPDAALSYDGLVTLTKISDILSEKKNEGILSARSLTNVSTISLGEDDTVKASYLIPSVPRTEQAREELKNIILADTQVKGALISEDLKGYLILVQTDPRKDLRPIADLVQEIVEQNKGKLNSYYFGAPFVASTITNGVYKKLVWLIPLFGLFMFAVLFIGIRKPLVIAVVILCSGSTVLWWLGLLYVAGVPLSTSTANGALFILAVAMVVYSRGAEGWMKQIHFPFPARSLYFLVIAALALYALSFASLPFLASFGISAALGALAIALFGPLAFGPIMSLVKPDGIKQTEKVPFNLNRKIGLTMLVLIVAVGIYATLNMRFYINLSETFSKESEVVECIDFFNRHFGGSDFMQINLKADLKDPAVLTRVAVLADLLEGETEFPDVRAISQVVSFIASNFSGIHRIPDTKEGLKNLLFFLEGSEDIKPMVTKEWNEAMIAIRVPGGKPKTEHWRNLVQKAIDNSLLNIHELTKMRLEAVSKRFGMKGFSFKKAEHVVGLADFKKSDDNTAVMQNQIGKLKEYMFSPDSPFEPSEDDWQKLSEVLQTSDGDLEENLTTTILSLENYKKLEYPVEVANELSEMLKVRRNQLLLEARSALLTRKFISTLDQQQNIPEALITKTQGIFADLLTNKKIAGKELTFTISGLPAIIGKIEKQLMDGTWHAAFILWAIMAVLVGIIVRDLAVAVRTGLEALVATLLTFFFGWTLGIQVDSASATLYILPPLITYFLSPWLSAAARYGKPKLAKYSKTFAISLAVGCLTLTLTGVLPIVRLGGVVALGMLMAVLTVTVSHCIPLKRAEK